MTDYEKTGKDLFGIINREKGEPVWKCKICNKKYQKLSMVKSHILNKHKKRGVLS